MPDHVAFLLDAPALPDGTGPVTSEHPIAKLGRYKDPRYGRFSIDRKQFDSWVKNFHALDGGRIAIDRDHSAPRPGGSTKAAGWITGLNLVTGSQLQAKDAGKYKALEPGCEYALATIEWTPEGAEDVRNRYWLYVSPEFKDHYLDDQQVDHGPGLEGVTLTNRPFLRKGMPAISLSRTHEEVAFAAAEATGDSRDRMPELTKIAEALRLSADATEDQILEAITATGTDLTAIAKKLSLPDDADETRILAKLDEQPDRKTLDAQAQEQGKVLLEKSTLDQLTSDAAAGKKAAEDLAEGKIADAIKLARSEGRMDAKDETEAKYRKLYALDAATTLDVIAELPKMFSVAPGGTNGGQPADAGDNVDADHLELHRAAEAYASEHDMEYEQALERVVLARSQG